MDEEAEEIALVRKAILSGLSNCLHWIDDKTMRRVRDDSSVRGFGPADIRALLIRHVLGGGVVSRRRELRAEYHWRREWWFRAVIPMDEFPSGLFVELELLDRDPDVPVVVILNAHP